ncbi:MAG: AAA family ATPase [Bacteroidales bacterium]|nr:AAA family ATPase [Bacteroidales bacterium]
MIQELKVKNFMSFRDEVMLNFEATKDKTFDKTHLIEVEPGVRLLRFAMVYGANASGKSNLLYALDFLQEFIFSKANDLEEKTGTVPFKLDVTTPDKPSEFCLKFYTNSTRYCYELQLDQQRVYLERLYYYASNRPTKLFERTWERGESVLFFNPSVIKISPAAIEELSLKCLPNMSFFAARAQVNVAMPEIDAAREWFRNGIMPIVQPRTRMFEYASEKMLENNILKEYLLDFVHRADFNISDVKTVMEKQPIPQKMLNMMLLDDDAPSEVKEKLKQEKTYDQVRTSFVHQVHNNRGDETYTLPDIYQSEGTRRTIGIEAAIFEALQKQAFLFIDEIESSLHPDLVEFVIEQFLSQSNRSQLLVTTHYDPLLNTVGDDLIRKDSVWFTEKDETGNTDLYSLVEYKGLNRISSLQKAYRNGVFGALPNIKK